MDVTAKHGDTACDENAQEQDRSCCMGLTGQIIMDGSNLGHDGSRLQCNTPCTMLTSHHVTSRFRVDI